MRKDKYLLIIFGSSGEGLPGETWPAKTWKKGGQEFPGAGERGRKFFPILLRKDRIRFLKWEQNQSLMCSQGVGLFIAHLSIAMLTTEEVLEELRRVGVKDRISLRAYLKDFEDYMMTYYGVKILDRKKKLPLLPARKRPPAT